MHIGPTISRVKLMVSALIDTLKDTQKDHPNTTYDVQVQLTLVPGRLTDSETLSFLNQLEGAVSKFSSEAAGNIQLAVIPKHAADEGIEKSMESRLTAALELEANRPKLVTKA